MAKKKQDWPPLGATLTNCEHCGGSGMSRRAKNEHEQSRAATSSGKLNSLRCGYCNGRGKRILGEPADKSCNHGLAPADCRLCNPDL